MLGLQQTGNGFVGNRTISLGAQSGVSVSSQQQQQQPGLRELQEFNAALPTILGSINAVNR